MASFNDIDQRQAAARYALNLKADRDRARTLKLEAIDLLGQAEVAGSALGDLHHNLAALFTDLDDDAQAEPLARTALELELAHDADPWTLGNYFMFLAKVLHRRGKAAEALSYARDGLAAFLRVWKPDHPELAFVRAEIAAIEADIR